MATNIKALIKSGAVNPSFAGAVVQVENTVIPECYDMEMIVALALRVNSPAERIRRYVVERVTRQPRQVVRPYVKQPVQSTEKKGRGDLACISPQFRNFATNMAKPWAPETQVRPHL